MSRKRMVIAVASLVSVLMPMIAQTGRKPAPNEALTSQGQSAPSNQISRGERVFKENCSRCHNAPQGFPPQISGSIVRHMRVRASLSAADERAILKFFNP